MQIRQEHTSKHMQSHCLYNSGIFLLFLETICKFLLELKQFWNLATTQYLQYNSLILWLQVIKSLWEDWKFEGTSPFLIWASLGDNGFTQEQYLPIRIVWQKLSPNGFLIGGYWYPHWENRILNQDNSISQSG